ncbi:hypothetical protein NE237_021386 [Protea cynaroides]|uniref:Uncharacterized protein n=1 Tax=Protea cynaroides TaxID=273540 RepID=A0A9Q0H7R6_9MAGN|nr:hypothetical protein NE237_021386 [Protea cynaroides]
MNEALLLTHPKSGEKRKSDTQVSNQTATEAAKKLKIGKDGFLGKQVSRVDFDWDCFTRLTVPMFEVLQNLRGTQYELAKPPLMKSDPGRERSVKYYHCENGHETDKYHALRYAIEDLIKRGHIREYVDMPPKADSRQKGKQHANKENDVE